MSNWHPVEALRCADYHSEPDGGTPTAALAEPDFSTCPSTLRLPWLAVVQRAARGDNRLREDVWDLVNDATRGRANSPATTSALLIWSDWAVETTLQKITAAAAAQREEQHS